MVMLCSLTQAKDHLRIDTSDGDNDLTLKIHAASAAVLNYIRNGADVFLDSSGEPVLDSNSFPLGIPYEVQAATLLMLGILYKDRDENDNTMIGGGFEQGYLPKPVTALLYHLRIPSLR
ncbi:MAG: head-tail connector protein [Gallionella sp.]|jgi:hypothetical protein